MDLVELMGSNQGRQPPEILFWKSVVEEGTEAANALIEMNEVGAIALLYAFTHNFDGISFDYIIAHESEGNPKNTSFTNRLVVSHEALEKIFSLPIKRMMPREYWVALWSLSNPDDFVRKVSTPKVESNKPSWYKNNFLVALVVGAILWFGIQTVRNRQVN